MSRANVSLSHHIQLIRALLKPWAAQLRAPASKVHVHGVCTCKGAHTYTSPHMPCILAHISTATRQHPCAYSRSPPQGPLLMQGRTTPCISACAMKPTLSQLLVPCRCCSLQGCLRMWEAA